jgi:IMP dehydrogenase
MRNIRKALSFDDILIEPHFSKVHPSKVDLTSKVGGRVLHFPVFSAAMDTLTGLEMAQAIGDYGGCGIIHKNMSIGEQSDLAHALLKYKYSKERPFTFGAAIGVGDMDRLLSLYKHNPDFIVIDAAHGHTQAMIDFFKEIQHKLDFTFDPGNFIVGNVTTVDAVRDLYKAGVRIIKIGQGSGSICSTRVVAGIGVPQFQALIDIHDRVTNPNYNEYKDLSIIADGGLRYSGDIVKALAAGAHAVMLGGMLAGTDESLGGDSYRGMGSIPAMEAGSADRYNQGGERKLTPEGVEGKVHRKGPVSEVLKQIEGGLRAGMGYTGSRTIEELREVNFVEITNSGLKESHPHSLLSIKSAPNYQV